VRVVACRADQFSCLNAAGGGGCVPASWTCDGYNGCSDWSDELNCCESFIIPPPTVVAGGIIFYP